MLPWRGAGVCLQRHRQRRQQIGGATGGIAFVGSPLHDTPRVLRLAMHSMHQIAHQIQRTLLHMNLIYRCLKGFNLHNDHTSPRRCILTSKFDTNQAHQLHTPQHTCMSGSQSERKTLTADQGNASSSDLFTGSGAACARFCRAQIPCECRCTFALAVCKSRLGSHAYRYSVPCSVTLQGKAALLVAETMPARTCRRRSGSMAPATPTSFSRPCSRKIASCNTC